MNNLNSRPFVKGGEHIKVRFISADGVPTPSGDLPINRTAFGFSTVQTMFSDKYFNGLPAGSKIMALYLSELLGAVVNENGDIYAPRSSQQGEGLSILSAANVDFRSPQNCSFGDDLNGIVEDSFIAMGLASSLACIYAPPTIHPMINWGCALVFAGGSVYMFLDRKDDLLSAHGLVVKEAYQQHLIDNALDDYVAVGGGFKTSTIKSGLSASVVSSSTAGYTAPEQAFDFFTDLDLEGKPTGVYQSVTIEAFTDGDPKRGFYFPIAIDGQARWVSAVTVKKAPSAIKGVAKTFLPKKMKYFEYSENFAAWKPIANVDEWGNFTVKDLKLAEGQNIIAFKAETWTGLKTNQQLKIVLNTIPMQPSQFKPLPEFYVSTVNPEISVEFNKSEYSGSFEAESINIKKTLLDGADVPFEVERTMETYHPKTKVSLKPSQPLSDGEHQVMVVAESNVGVAQAAWSFYVDTRAPSVAIEPLPSYSPRAPATIRYTASDEVSPNLRSVRCDLYDKNDNLVTTIATADSLSKGENYFTWDGKYGPLHDSGEGGPRASEASRVVGDGAYKVKVKVFDLAGNSAVAETPLIVDATPPKVGLVALTPNPMTSNINELKLNAEVSEKAMVIIKLNNLSNKKTTAYLTQASTPLPLGEGTGVRVGASYSWPYNNSFAPGPEDGIYRVEVIARDEAGNESAPRTLEAVRIDRTPPTIFGQIANPYVLTNIGANAYKTTLAYSLRENGLGDKGEGVGVKVKIFNTSTGLLADAYEEAPASLTEENKIVWHSASDLTKGAYKFQITATDDVGNTSTAYSSCVKDGIAPVISFPVEDGAEISGLVAIRGTAMDPDWSNDKPFKQYRVYLSRSDKSKMEAATILSQASELVPSAIEVPLINRGGGASNISFRPLQNDATLAYLNTNGLENGDYTILVVVDEENGDSLSVTRLIKVNNGSFGTSALTSPYIKLKPLASTVDFKADDSVKLPIGFINSVKPANVYVEIIRSQDEKPVYFKYFPNILGAPFIGKPDYKAGTDLGYFIWSDESGYHIRWSADGSSHKFSGNLIAMGGTVNITGGNSSVSSVGSMISWNKILSGGEGGFDFTADGGQLMITPKLDEDPSSPSIYADNVYLGITRQTQPYLPLVIDVTGQRLVNLTEMGKTFPSTAVQPPSGIDWDGRLDTGAYVDNGSYIVRVIAEGVDGQGLASDEAVINVTTPFELKVKEATNKEFSSLSVPDRVSVFYNVSKDALITAQVQKENGDFVASLAVGKEVLGTLPTNPLSLVWTGNYPASDSTQVVTGGTYKLILTAAAKDGSGSRTETISGIKVVSFARNEALVKLEPIGDETDYNDGLGLKKIRLADGESPFYFEAKGYGNYHPVKELTYTLTALGKQKLTAYPYVPFAGLMHRGFNEVDTKIKVKFKIHAWNHYLGAEDNWALGKFWNPMKWRRETHELIEEKWIAVDNLPGGAGVGTVFKVGDQVKNYTFNFDSYNWWPQNENDHYYNKDKFGCGIDAVDVQVEVYTKNSGFVLDKSVDWILVSQEKPTIKGIFSTAYSGSNGESHYGTLVSGGNRYDKTYGTYQVNLTIKLEAPIAYSRLTNRFVPWFGFVRANEAKQKDFSEYLTDINRGLGFPGKLFFDDPLAKPDVPYKPISEIETELAGLSWSERSKKLKLMSEQANLLGYKDSLASSAGYDSYLSDEYYEFVPITYPQQADGSRAGLDYSSGSTVVRAHSDLAYHGDGNPQSPFEFSWPWRESEYTTFTASQTAQQKRLDKELGGEPQNYTGPTITGTWWKLDETQVNQRRLSLNNSIVAVGQIHYNKNSRRGEWSSLQNPVTSRNVDQILVLPSYVYDKLFQVASNTPGIKLSLSSSAPGAVVQAEDQDINGFPWTTGDDGNLAATRGFIKSPALTFNPDAFRSRRSIKLSSAYQVVDDYQSVGAARFTFLKKHPWEPDNEDSPVDNPNLEIDRWEVVVKDKSGAVNKDVALENVTTGAGRLNDALSLKLKIDASEARYVEIKGFAPGPYEILYYDGKSWQSITQSFDETPTGGRLAWWNVSRLNGEYTVMLRSGSYISTQNVSIGTLIKKDDGGDAWSTYKRAQLKFPPHAFGGRDQLATVTPVTMKEIKIRNKPIILTSGPIVEIKPSPWKFTVSSLEGVDLRPTLRFVYTFDELKELGAWSGEGEPKNLLWNIHQVTEAGDLQIVSDNQQTIEENNGEKHYVFYAALDHFSTYTLLPGKFKLSAPIVLADRYITNKNSVTIYGTAEPGSILNLIVRPSPVEAGEGGPRASEASRVVDEGITADEKGNFRIENVPLLQEGANYIYLTAHPLGNSEILTCGDVMVTKDTVPPTVGIAPNLYAFSPNGDGKYDSVDYLLTMNEKGKIYLGVKSDSNDLINIDAPLLAGKELKVNWSKEGYELYRRDSATGLWILYSQLPNPSNLIDGEYSVATYAIDEAGNISENIIVKTIIDLTPPKVLGLNADPNPFTPNDDGVKDTASFWYKFSEPVAVKLGIYREDGGLFKNTEGETEKFTYPTTDRNRDVQSQVPSVGQWSWDGRGNRNELLGGAYTYYVYAEDRVGNAVSSEVKTVVVDREPTLIPYAFAEPDPFAPVNSNNNFTDIKYYLGRDNLKIKVLIIGREGKALKTLVNDEVQAKGEHSARWCGDFDSGYEGPTAAANKYRVADSSYQFKVVAEDINELGSNTAEASNTVLVDNVPPAITIKGLAVDYKNNLVSLIYSIPEISAVEVSVYDKNGALLAALVTGAQNDGDHQINYLISGEGERYIGITARDRAKNSADVKTEIFSTRPDTLRLTNCQAIPATFTPNGDGLIDITRISYSLAGGVPDCQVSLDILNSTGSTVKSLVVSEPQGSGAYSFYWDGKNDAGQLAPDGYYDYVVRAQDKLGAQVEGRGRLLMIAARPTVGLSANVPAISPNNSEANSKVVLNYTVNYSTFYITGEALVKLEVLNSSAGAVWSKIFNKTAGSYLYDYDGLTTSGLPLTAGQYYVRASAEDALGGTAVPQTIPLGVDYSSPAPSNFTIVPAYARSGASVRLCLAFDEQLAESPTIGLTLVDGTVKTLSVASAESGSYECGYVIGSDDLEGTVEVSVSARDLAMNPIVRTSSFVIDKTNPLVSDLSVSPNPASAPLVNGQVSVKFNVSEPLKEAPKVYVTQNGAPPQLQVTSGQWQIAGQCEAKFSALAGYDGPALITIEATDLAGNQSTIQSINNLTIDTVAPIFSSIRSEIGGNPEFTKFAREGSEVAISFDVAETLKFNPEVKVNEVVATFSRRLPAPTGETYEYKYTISNTDANGNATISISGLDFALNEGTAETSSSSESFVIDLINPTVAIALPNTPGEYISNPSNFSTNANPDGSDRPRSTTFYYSLPESSKVTVKVYKVPDGQTTTKADFNDNNLIKTLVADLWQSGSQTVLWEGKNQSGDWAVPGKYAFIVEGRDRAGNLTLKKWGGTVWIQNNVLSLRAPEQLELASGVTNNPDPPAISPNGNSLELTQKRARFYFMIDLSLVPAAVEAAERIEAMGVTVNTEPVGKYSVKVYSDSAMSNLIRTITPDAVAQSRTLSWEDWDGKADGGAYASNGNYWLAVELQDYAGNKQPLLVGQVTIDNTLPEIKNVLAAPYYFAPGGTNSSFKTTTCSYEVADNSGKVKVVIGAYSGSALVKTLTADAWQVNGNYFIDWDGAGATGYVGSANGSGFSDGEYTLKILAYDEAGNSCLQSANVKVDTLPPDGGVVIGSGNPQFTNSPTVELFASASDPTSGVTKMSFSNDGASWSSWEDYSALGKAWLLPAVDGTRTARVRLMDNAGNYSTAVFADQIVLDTAAPVIKSVVQPQPVTINSPATSLLGVMADFNGGVDTISGLNNWQIKIVNSGGSVVKTFGATVTPAQTGDLVINQEWEPTGDGYYYYYFTATDAAGNAFDSRKAGSGAYKPFGGNDAYYRIVVDKTAPTLNISSPTANQWVKGSINIVGSAADANSGPYKVDYAPMGSNTWTTIATDSCPVSGTIIAWNTLGVDGDYDIRLSATDQFSNYAETKITIKIDNTPPVINLSQTSLITFNPYVDGSARVDFTASDSAPSSGFAIGNVSSVVKYGGTVVKNLTVTSNGSGGYYVSWDGTNNSGDYENEGSYSIEIGAVDAVGNNAITVSRAVSLQDDVYIGQGDSPYITFNGVLYLSWLRGVDDSQQVIANAYVSDSDHGSDPFGPYGDMYYVDKEYFTLDFPQVVETHNAAFDEWAPSESHAIKRASDDVVMWSMTQTGNDETGSAAYYTATLPAGQYYAYVYINDEGSNNTYAFTKAYYYDRRYNQYIRTSDNYGTTWSIESGPEKVDGMQTSTSVTVNGILHEVYANNGIYYRRNNGTAIKISSFGASPCIFVDSSGNSYVAWHLQIGLNSQVYFQKVPINFARAKGTAQGAAVKITPQTKVISQTTTLESPALLAPAKDRQDVQNIRPAFEWEHHKGDTTEYRVEVAKNDSFTIDHQTFSKAAGTGTQDKADSNLYYFNYAIHEFDPGLERNTDYFWKVTALSPTNAATSESWGFRIQPELTLAGVTNYPNPFNPNREETKLRYRLSADADEVRIRIYDITGSLVTELDGTTNGEGMSVWQKYNDVSWDGRNGRGDMVVNGIYPFEITARMGDKTVSGRGKIAVLK
ncbi:MAG: FlgD immunoglobulin-like domain containing protein [Patescibacteria group bacterium]